MNDTDDRNAAPEPGQDTGADADSRKDFGTYAGAGFPAGSGDGSSSGSGLYVGPGARATPGLLSYDPQTGQANTLFHWADAAQARNREAVLSIKPFGDNPEPTTLTPNMLVLAPYLENKHPNIFTPEAFRRGMDKYAPRWGMDRETLLRTVGNTAQAEQEGPDQGAAAQQGQENSPDPLTRNQTESESTPERITPQGTSQEEANPSGGQAYAIAENGILHLYDAQGNLAGSYPFTSGKEGVTDPSIKDNGPIPPGEYTFHANDINHVENFRYLMRRFKGDWGHYRVPLSPDASTNTYGRSNFFIHGGLWPGSMGCIDVGEGEWEVFPALKGLGGKFRLTVK